MFGEVEMLGSGASDIYHLKSHSEGTTSLHPFLDEKH